MRELKREEFEAVSGGVIVHACPYGGAQSPDSGPPPPPEDDPFLEVPDL